MKRHIHSEDTQGCLNYTELLFLPIALSKVEKVVNELFGQTVGKQTLSHTECHVRGIIYQN